MTSQSDQQYLEQLTVQIEQLGIKAERHSNLVSIASRLTALRAALMRVIEPGGGGVTGVCDVESEPGENRPPRGRSAPSAQACGGRSPPAARHAGTGVEHRA